MFSNTAEYALRAVVFLATRADTRWSSGAIAKSTSSPPGYVSKVLKDLVDAGIILSQRGPSGGFTLARTPDRISVLEVINAVDPWRRIETCPLGIESHGTRLCKLHRRLDDSMALVQRELSQATIAEMLQPAEGHSTCLFPTVSVRPSEAP